MLASWNWNCHPSHVATWRISPQEVVFLNPGDLKEVKVILMGQSLSLETEGGEEGPRIIEIQETLLS